MGGAEVAAVYSVLLGRGVLAAAGSIDVFTAASGVTTIIRDIWLTAYSASTEVFLSIAGVVTFLDQVHTPGSAETFHYECRVVLVPGDVVSFATATSGGQVMISGYVLSA